MSRYSTVLNNLPLLPQGIIDEALSIEFIRQMAPADWPPTIKNDVYHERFTIKADSSFDDSNFTKLLRTNLGKVRVNYFKTMPHTFFDFHVDGLRGTAINFLMKANPLAITLHRYNNTNLNFWEIEEVKYELYRPVLFDIKQEHCVVNNTSDERIIMSMSLFESTYQDALTFLSSLDIKEY